jgi:hypothetical protein
MIFVDNAKMELFLGPVGPWLPWLQILQGTWISSISFRSAAAFRISAGGTAPPTRLPAVPAKAERLRATTWVPQLEIWAKLMGKYGQCTKIWKNGGKICENPLDFQLGNPKNDISIVDFPTELWRFIGGKNIYQPTISEANFF